MSRQIHLGKWTGFEYEQRLWKDAKSRSSVEQSKFPKSAVELADLEIGIVSGLSFGQIEVRPAPMVDLRSYTSPLEEAISLEGFGPMHVNSWLLAYLPRALNDSRFSTDSSFPLKPFFSSNFWRQQNVESVIYPTMVLMSALGDTGCPDEEFQK